jgi:hypothetical protein
VTVDTRNPRGRDLVLVRPDRAAARHDVRELCVDPLPPEEVCANGGLEIFREA